MSLKICPTFGIHYISDEAIIRRAKVFDIPVFSIATERDLKIWMQTSKRVCIKVQIST